MQRSMDTAKVVADILAETNCLWTLTAKKSGLNKAFANADDGFGLPVLVFIACVPQKVE